MSIGRTTRARGETRSPATDDTPRARRTSAERPRSDRFAGTRAGAGEDLRPVGSQRAEKPRPARFEVGATHEIAVPEPSGLAYLGEGRGFLVVSDREKKVFQVTVGRNGETETREFDPDGGGKRLAGLEGVAWDPDSGSVLVLSESRADVSEMTFGRNKGLGGAEKLGNLPDITREANNGWEGLAYLPASLAADKKPHLLATHEASPRRLSVFTRDGLEEEASLKLDVIPDGPEDISDVTVDPRTGHVFVLSDLDNAVYELMLKHTHRPGAGGRLKSTWELAFIGKTELPESRRGARLQPEGLAFDHAGDLWVAAEQGQSLLQLRRKD